MNKQLFIALMVIMTLQLTLALKKTACAASWYELVCETGDYIPIFMRGVWGSSSTDVFLLVMPGISFSMTGRVVTP